MKRIDHAEASSSFIAAKDNEAFHDKRLWDLRLKRDRMRDEVPEWNELRELASAIKTHTLTHLADYLEQFDGELLLVSTIKRGLGLKSGNRFERRHRDDSRWMALQWRHAEGRRTLGRRQL